nr:ARMT1-like domain-containing protein [Candidatus Freyarchaeota archaeon]
METELDCIPCFLRQALEAVRMVTTDRSKQEKVLREVLSALSKVSFEGPPTEIAHVVHGIVKRAADNPDPYREVKEKSNRMALELYPKLKQMVQNSDNRLLTAVKLAIAGNIIDYGPSSQFDVNKTIEEVLSQDLEINDFEKFESMLRNAKNVVYLGDNAGEIVFDRVLIEEMPDKKVTFFVRAEPILNDATIDDAVTVGIDKLAEIRKISVDHEGVDRNSEEFIEFLRSADMVISKGQGNYEALSDRKAGVFFLLKVKCPAVAKHIGARVGSTVLKFEEKEQR